MSERAMKTWDEMDSRSKDALVATEVMERDPEIIHIATNDGGESACASTGMSDLWRTEGDLREWLERQKERGHHLDYEMGTWERYPRYSTDIACAWEVVEKMRAEGVYIDVEPRSDRYDAVAGWAGNEDEDIWAQAFVTGIEAPEVICKAALRAKGVDV